MTVHMSKDRALHEIADIMSGVEWDADTHEAVNDVLYRANYPTLQLLSDPLPIHWEAWRWQWKAWLRLRRNQLTPSFHRFPEEPNFLADEVLGVWQVPKGDVELSEVTFPDFTGPGHRERHRARYVGLTWAHGDAMGDTLVSTFGDLDRELGFHDA